MARHIRSPLKVLRGLALAGAASLALAACALNPGLPRGSDPQAAPSRSEAQASLSELTARYRSRPRDKAVILQYATALRVAGQTGQAASVLELGMGLYKRDPEISIAYAKALAAEGRFDQALSVIDASLVPQAPDWNALLVKGAILDQMGRNGEAPQVYGQALAIAPGEASLYANLGLSYAMTNELDTAERHLRRAAGTRGASSQVRQNLALVVGLQGRFEEARGLFAAELPPDQVEANMAYIRALLTQQNRWDLLQGE